jgi:hypothetical protein
VNCFPYLARGFARARTRALGRYARAASLTRFELLSFSLVLASLCAPLPLARADQDACLKAHERAQLERIHGRFLEARQQLLTCVQASCPGVVRDDCRGWLQEVESSLPSVVFAVADELGRDLIDARVSSEEGLLSDRADGRALAINPGVHKVRIEARGYAPAEQQVSVREGEKRRLVRVVLRMSGSAPERAARPAQVASAPDATGEPGPPQSDLRARRLLLSGYTLAGVGVATLAAGSAVGIVGQGELEDLRSDNCRPDCDAGKVEAGKRKFVAANVAFGVGGALLAAAVVTWFLGFRKRREMRPGALASVAADAHGVSLGWGARF